MSGVGPQIWGGKLLQILGANWFKSETLGPSKLCEWSPKSKFSHFGKSGKFGTQFGSMWGAMGSKMASIWRLRSHVKSRAVARSLQEASGSPVNRGGDPTGGQTGPRGGGQQEEGKDLRRLVDPKGSADDGKR